MKPENVRGDKNKRVAQLLARFCSDDNTWDLSGVDTIYVSVVTCIKDAMRCLDLDERYGWVVDKLQSSEALLRIDTHYRDHFIHQFQVFLLGYCIINTQHRVRDTLLAYLKGVGAEKDGQADMDDVVRCWLLASLYHDVAYSLERYEVWLGEHFGQLFPGGRGRRRRPAQPLGLKLAIPWGNLLGIQEAAPEYYKTRICSLIHERVGAGAEERMEGIVKILTQAVIDDQNHGLLGGLVVRHSYGVAKGTELDFERILVDEAAMAIALHTSSVHRRLADVTEAKLDPECLPFAFLLVFCDSAQDWGRPLVSELYGTDAKAKRPKITLRNLKIDDSGACVDLEHSVFPEQKWRNLMREPCDAWSASAAMPCQWRRFVGKGDMPFEECW